ncbi:MAG: hypothetical protein KGY66_05895 [Candidatus Thermoplasmatota archaeon]|nr:hypothetical protein [Candidatus Thermoplasmatota archaeon]MBS3790431.1 hypothetical protein [Candidatus Thermoplasmatota archaeon]
MDEGGYFIIVPEEEKGIIAVKHFSNEDRLLRVIKGQNVKNIYHTIIDNEWITELSHAAYLGKELERAKLSMDSKSEITYTQGGC